MTTRVDADYDAIIIGSGPAGASAAILLARAGWAVAVVEKTPFPRRKVCGEFVSATSWPLLHELGVAEALLEIAGPEIQQVGLYAGQTCLAAAMPFPRDGLQWWGRALGRECLDTLLLARAAKAGTEVWQPWKLLHMKRDDRGFVCTVIAKDTSDSGKTRDLRGRVIIAAHGSWESGAIPTQSNRYPARASDLFAFKANFLSSQMSSGLMPLLVFPGGYGGLVHTDNARVSLSCCIRRDYLERCRRQCGNLRAGEAVLAHIQGSCRGVDAALSGAKRDGAWLSAGPIRPGIRSFQRNGIYIIGNAAGEAHPIVAEGISMAIQSAWLLCEQIIARKETTLSGQNAEAIGRDYAHLWCKNFAPRIHAAAMFAQLFMRPVTARLAVGLLQRAPAILQLGARLSGKAQPLRGAQKLDTALTI